MPTTHFRSDFSLIENVTDLILFCRRNLLDDCSRSDAQKHLSRFFVCPILSEGERKKKRGKKQCLRNWRRYCQDVCRDEELLPLFGNALQIRWGDKEKRETNLKSSDKRTKIMLHLTQRITEEMPLSDRLKT